MESRKDNNALLTAVFVTALVLSNILGAKLLTLGPVSVPGGVLCYAVTFLVIDVIGQRSGKQAAERTVLIGLFCQLMAVLLIGLTLLLPTGNAEIGQAFQTALGFNKWFVFGGILAYLVSQTVDVSLFHAIKNWLESKGRTCKWVWNNASTLVSQAVDTVIFIGIAFGFGMRLPIAQLGWLALSQYLVKVILALLDTPIFYFLTRRQE